jgi:NADPH:quinone reductase-like Zn-dependent oxidoreductase
VTTARAVAVTEPGGAWQVVEREVREPGPGEVRIAVAAAAVNPTDAGVRERGIEGVDPPWVPGADAAGTIEAIGEGVDRLAVGDEAMAIVSPRRPEGGGQSALVVVPAASVVRTPEGMSLVDAATISMNGMTTLLGFDELGLESGDTLGVSGGAGFLASFVIAYGKSRGLRVVADAAPADEALVRGFGADVVLPRGDGFPAAVRDAAPDGVDGFVDTALLYDAAFPAIRDGGSIVTVRGWRGGDPVRGIEIHPVLVYGVVERTDWLENVRALAEQGVFRPRVAETFPPERAAEAQALMDAGGLRGRAVIVF